MQHTKTLSDADLTRIIYWLFGRNFKSTNQPSLTEKFSTLHIRANKVTKMEPEFNLIQFGFQLYKSHPQSVEQKLAGLKKYLETYQFEADIGLDLIIIAHKLDLNSLFDSSKKPERHFKKWMKKNQEAIDRKILKKIRKTFKELSVNNIAKYHDLYQEIKQHYNLSDLKHLEHVAKIINNLFDVLNKAGVRFVKHNAVDFYFNLKNFIIKLRAQCKSTIPKFISNKKLVVNFNNKNFEFFPNSSWVNSLIIKFKQSTGRLSLEPILNFIMVTKSNFTSFFRKEDNSSEVLNDQEQIFVDINTENQALDNSSEVLNDQEQIFVDINTENQALDNSSEVLNDQEQIFVDINTENQALDNSSEVPNLTLKIVQNTFKKVAHLTHIRIDDINGISLLFDSQFFYNIIITEFEMPTITSLIGPQDTWKVGIRHERVPVTSLIFLFFERFIVKNHIDGIEILQNCCDFVVIKEGAILNSKLYKTVTKDETTNGVLMEFFPNYLLLLTNYAVIFGFEVWSQVQRKLKNRQNLFHYFGNKFDDKFDCEMYMYLYYYCLMERMNDNNRSIVINLLVNEETSINTQLLKNCYMDIKSLLPLLKEFYKAIYRNDDATETLIVLRDFILRALNTLESLEDWKLFFDRLNNYLINY